MLIFVYCFTIFSERQNIEYYYISATPHGFYVNSTFFFTGNKWIIKFSELTILLDKIDSGPYCREKLNNDLAKSTLHRLGTKYAQHKSQVNLDFDFNFIDFEKKKEKKCQLKCKK
ncbi:hypothetical protein BpHYR1_001391 [Brachionus plicatilis]|uniref:Uncharacterized protein n=1 Tax=Brachionus plicatilis TaxID=10195 RepID=A0A3M7QGG2_BRAPC|nr:hypothetical protein BpHYR1_001391 [Brachionus plicatilis]